LHARCLVLDDGHAKLALVVLDLLLLDRNLDLSARKLIEQEVGIPAQNVLISAVHTHSATLAGNGPFPFSPKVKNYPGFFVRRIVNGVKCAANRLRPAQLAFTTVEAPEHVFNRRWFLNPGTMPPNPFGGIDQVKMNPAAGSPNLVKPVGRTDLCIAITQCQIGGFWLGRRTTTIAGSEQRVAIMSTRGNILDDSLPERITQGQRPMNGSRFHLRTGLRDPDGCDE
jgi:hypothetical protein